MLHTIYWYKVEARFIEAWHLIGVAVCEAQELGLPRDCASMGPSGHSHDMRQRIWCVLSIWDWQFASVLGRPTTIVHRDVHIIQSITRFKGHDLCPLLHITLQAEAVAMLATRFGPPRNVKSTKQIQDYVGALESWMSDFPPIYSTKNPDLSRDMSCPWVASHRFHLHTMAYLTVLSPLRAHMVKTYSESCSKEVLRIRGIGVHYALRVVETAVAWAKHGRHTGGAFYYLIFSLFDAASVLSAAVVRDEYHSIPQRLDVLHGIDRAVKLLEHLGDSTKVAATALRVLYRLVRQVPGSVHCLRRKQVKRPTSSIACLPEYSPQLSKPDQPCDNPSDTVCSTMDEGASRIRQPGPTSPRSGHACSSATANSVVQSQNIANLDAKLPALDAQWHLYRTPQSRFALPGDTPTRPNGLALASVRVEGQFGEPATSGNVDVEPNPDNPDNPDNELGDFLLWEWGSLSQYGDSCSSQG